MPGTVNEKNEFIYQYCNELSLEAMKLDYNKLLAKGLIFVEKYINNGVLIVNVYCTDQAVKKLIDVVSFSAIPRQYYIATLNNFYNYFETHDYDIKNEFTDKVKFMSLNALKILKDLNSNITQKIEIY